MFHGKLDGETALRDNVAVTRADHPDAFSHGLLVGLLIGEGHFGGDGKQPHVTLRMHVKHERVFEWLQRTFPESKLYGPYSHGGRAYYQWMARGEFLRRTLVPLLRDQLEALDAHAAERFNAMCERYAITDPAAASGEDV
jgi:hypothetical protein